MDCEAAPESQKPDRAFASYYWETILRPRPYADGQERCSFPLWYGPSLPPYHGTPCKPGLTRLQLGPIREPDTTHHIRRIVPGPPCPLAAFTSRFRAGCCSAMVAETPGPSDVPLGSETGSGSVSTLQVTVNRVAGERCIHLFEGDRHGRRRRSAGSDFRNARQMTKADLIELSKCIAKIARRSQRSRTKS
jgi:hypothetical protein